ncbi:MAG: hypothetical protein ACTS7I_03115, partial [Candidatus Hodgkinia cicadicola]
DIALITGAQVISSEAGTSLENATLPMLGSARRWTAFSWIRGPLSGVPLCLSFETIWKGLH